MVDGWCVGAWRATPVGSVPLYRMCPVCWRDGGLNPVAPPLMNLFLYVHLLHLKHPPLRTPSVQIHLGGVAGDQLVGNYRTCYRICQGGFSFCVNANLIIEMSSEQLRPTEKPSDRFITSHIYKKLKNS